MSLALEVCLEWQHQPPAGRTNSMEPGTPKKTCCMGHVACCECHYLVDSCHGVAECWKLEQGGLVYLQAA
jgi:hypothetical protein